jgi:acyl-CoA thioesterase
MMAIANHTPQQLADACIQSMWNRDGASQALGMTVTAVAPGEARVTMPIKPYMLNGHGTCHGGYIFTLADSAFAFASNTYDQRAVGQHCSITYLTPAKGGDHLTAHAREHWRSGRSGMYDVTIINQDGVPVAEFRGHSRTVKGTHLAGDAQDTGRA